MRVESIKKIYNLYAGIYEIMFAHFFFPRQKHVIENLTINPQEKILDVGIGTGLTLPLYPRHARVVGIDLSYGMLKEAWKKKEAEKMDHTYLFEMNAENMGFKDNTFDHVICTFVISVVPNPVQLINEMRRVCKPDGNIILVNHFKSENRVVGKIEEFINPLCTRVGWKSDLVLQHLVEQADLKIVHKYKWKKIDLWNIVHVENNKFEIQNKEKNVKPG